MSHHPSKLFPSFIGTHSTNYSTFTKLALVKKLSEEENNSCYKIHCSKNYQQQVKYEKKKVCFTNCCGFFEIYKFCVSIELIAYVRCITIQEASVSHFVNAWTYHGQLSLQNSLVLTI